MTGAFVGGILLVRHDDPHGGHLFELGITTEVDQVGTVTRWAPWNAPHASQAIPANTTCHAAQPADSLNWTGLAKALAQRTPTGPVTWLSLQAAAHFLVKYQVPNESAVHPAYRHKSPQARKKKHWTAGWATQ